MYKIPTDEEIAEAIDKVFEKNKEVASQSLFHDLVLKELKKKSPYYAASQDRVRKVAALGKVKIFVEKNKSSKEMKSCFICGGKLVTLFAKNLLGEKASAGKKCDACGFQTDKTHIIPRRYIFYR